MKYLLLLLLTACATPQNSEQAVFQMRGAQNVALRTAVAYKELKPCAEPKAQPCSEKRVVTQLQLADTVSDKAIGAAENAVRTPGFGQNIIDSAVTAAEAALAAFQSIIATLGGK
jgi:hypothetical protein